MSFFAAIFVTAVLSFQPPPVMNFQPPPAAVTNAVASFEGVFKSADKKFVEIQVNTGETFRMTVTRSTKFIRDGRTAKASDFQDGEKVTAEASRDIRFNLLAVKIELVKAEAKPADKTSGTPN